jgi:hypothetical protein
MQEAGTVQYIGVINNTEELIALTRCFSYRNKVVTSRESYSRFEIAEMTFHYGHALAEAHQMVLRSS